MITISKITSGDSVLINEDYPASKLYEAIARVNRAATLDGGVVIDHQGVVAGDRTLPIQAKVTETEESSLKTLFENETLVHVSTKHGFYSAAISEFKADSGDVNLTIFLKAVV